MDSKYEPALPPFGRRELAWVVAGLLCVVCAIAHGQPAAPAGTRDLNPRDIQVYAGPDTNHPVHGGVVSVGISGVKLSVKEGWKTREDRQLKYDVPQAYAAYYCGSSNVASAIGTWQPGNGNRAGWYTYDDTITVDCRTPKLVRSGEAPGGVKWSQSDAGAWLAPFQRGDVAVKAELRFGTLKSSDVNKLVQLAIYHSALTFRAATCPAQALLPLALSIETTPTERDSRADVLLSARFACD